MPALDGFRAVAALSVITLHSGYWVWLEGVTAFFVLSGFLITTLLLREFDATGTVSLKAFYARRTLRIFPAYYACVVASFAIDHVAGNAWPDGLVRSAFGYVVNYFNAFTGHPSTSIAHMWSLGVEEQFYLLWPALFLLLASLGRPVLRRGLIVIVLGCVAWRYVLYYRFGLGLAYLYNAFDARFDNLALGCLLATVVALPGAARAARWLAPTPWAPVITLLLSALMLHALPGVQRLLFGFTVYSALMAVLLVQLLELHRTPMWRWLDTRTAVFLGTISYPVYLYHAWGLGLGHWLAWMPDAVQVLAGTLFTIVGASGSYFLIERPFLELKKRFGSGSRPERVRAGRLVAPTSDVA